MKRFMVVVSIFLASVSAGAQTPGANAVSTCQLPINHSPVVRGIKLGMKLDDLLRLFPGADQSEWVKPQLQGKTGYPNFGIIHFPIFRGNLPLPDLFSGINQFNFTFIDDRLADYSVEYSAPPNGPEWQNIDDWVVKLSSSFNLPELGNWRIEQGRGGLTLKCNDFQVRASNLNQVGNLEVSTFELPNQERQTRMKAFNEKLRNDFRP